MNSLDSRPAQAVMTLTLGLVPNPHLDGHRHVLSVTLDVALLALRRSHRKVGPCLLDLTSAGDGKGDGNKASRVGTGACRVGEHATRSKRRRKVNA